jgi:glycosyltransferase involved in cell wall biosynthesis
MNKTQFNNVTYIINSFNRPSGLFNAIASVLRQSYPNISILVVDDCSTQEYPDKLKKLLNEECIYLRNKTNLGLAKSRDFGLQYAKSEYICFLDDDDVLVDVDKTQKQIDLLKGTKTAALVCTNIYEVDSEGASVAKNINWPNSRAKLKTHFYKRNGIVYPSTTMVRKSAFITVGGFDYAFKRGIDSDVYRRLLINGFEFLFIDEPTVNYLVQANDKITDDQTVNGIKKDISSQLTTIKKYWPGYLTHPLATLYRVKSILKASSKLIWYKIKLIKDS